MIEHGFTLEGNKRVVEALIKDAQVEHAKRVDTAIVNYTRAEVEAAEELDQEGIRQFRSLLGKEMYVAWDRPDIQYATMTASKGAAHPTVLDMMKVKRVARYLVHRQHLRWVYAVKIFTGHIEVYTDSDWGGDQKTRRSTSGGILCFEGCIIRTWAKLQTMVALSSAEAEYLAMTKGVHEALALRTALLELGVETYITIYTDSTAAKASAEKPGLMHMKHMQLRELFLKQIVQQGLVTLAKVRSEENPADLLTKAVNKKIVEHFWRELPSCWERDFDFEVNLIERELTTPKKTNDDGFWQCAFIMMNLLACVGMMWIIHMVKKIFIREGGQLRRDDQTVDEPQSRRRATLRTVATQSMSTWLRGRHDRFSPTPVADQGVFHRGLTINEDLEVDTIPRDINARIVQ